MLLPLPLKRALVMEKHHAEVRTQQIVIEIGQDAEGMNVDIRWKADGLPEAQRNSKAVLLSLFDRETRETMKVDLWTKDLMVMEMDRMMYNTLRALSDTYMKASNNKELAEQMHRFAQFFGEETEILPKS